ncbi:MAG: dCTP deaminase [Candidatus Hydrothermarchaeaceae archaeon]
MILSDRDIRKHLEEGRIVITPLRDPELQIQPSSVDLKLGRSFKIFRQTKKAYIDPVKDKVDDYTQDIILKKNENFILHPGEFVLGSTEERVELPDDMVARVEGRSSLGRLALLVHATAGYVDPGFRGNITLELSNVGKMPIALYPGMRICQISFETISSRAELPYGHPSRNSKYQEQHGPMSSRIYLDKEFKK